ncbi:YHYH domain-containing protein [Porticoccus sp. Uisw_050_02]|uniref:YHYH domain-containing protein n=1 Tax=Porticoccus sp. Uisw_050_02 TaxID=3230978 RepID=UPI0039EB5F15
MKKNIMLALLALVVSGSAVSLGFISEHTHDQKSITGIEIRNDHSGRTNSSGCHRETKTGGYHCH